MYAESANRPDIFVLQQYFLHAVADAVFLSHCVLECLTTRTASFWSRRRKTNAVAARHSESVFTMLTSSVLLCFVLLGSCFDEQDPTCANSGAHRLSFISGSRSRKTNWSLFSWSGLACRTHPLLHKPRIPLPFSCFFFSSLSPLFSLSCPSFALVCPKSRLSNYQRLACRVVPLDWVISTDCFPWGSVE